MSHSLRLAFCSLAIVEGVAILIVSTMILRAYRDSPKTTHIVGMAATVLGTVGAIILRMWQGHMDGEPLMMLWFVAMFALKVYFLWWFYERRPGAGVA